MISSVETDKLIQLLQTFPSAMGMAKEKDKLAIACLNEVVVLKNRPELAKSYPRKPNVYDGIYIPTARYNTGTLALHDMEFIDDKLVAVNTNFSCLSYINSENSFTPFWQPPFISKLKPEDRCHLNGLAVENNKIKYLTALGKSDKVQGWRDNKMNGGILMEYPSGKIILEDLSMPHSPRIYNGKLYLLNSAKGELICVNPETGTYEVIVKLKAFARGMSLVGDYLFIGVSKLRHNSKAFADLEIAKTSFSGIIAVYLPYKSIVGNFKYEMSVDEIYDVKIIENYRRPSILSPDLELVSKAVTSPAGSFWNLSEEDNQAQIQQHKFSFRLFKNIKKQELLQNFSPLLYSVFSDDIKNNKINGNLSALATLTENNQAVAMTIFETKKDKTAILHSIFVLPQFRRQKIAENMLIQTEKIFVQNKITAAEANYDNNSAESDILKNLFGKIKNIKLFTQE